MISYLLSKILTMVYGLLYPAYCSYKAVKTKDVKEYVHWMMYWIVFSIFSFFEVFADTFIGCWFPFYYELKILFMIWMLSPTTRGGSILYRRVIHPSLSNHEHEIDAYLAEFKLRTSSLLVQWGSKAFSYVSEFVMTSMLRIKPGDENKGFDMTLLQIPEIPCESQTSVAGAGEYRLTNKVSRTYSYENIGGADLNRNSQFRGLDDTIGSEDSFDSAPSAPPSTATSRQNIPADEMDLAGANVGLYKSKPFSMNDISEQIESQNPTARRISARKKKEANNVNGGTLPRTKRVSKRDC